MTTSESAQEHQMAGEPGFLATRRYTLTVAQLQQVIQQLPPEAEVLVGVNDAHHFNVLLGELPVLAAAAITGSTESALVLRVDGVS